MISSYHLTIIIIMICSGEPADQRKQECKAPGHQCHLFHNHSSFFVFLILFVRSPPPNHYLLTMRSLRLRSKSPKSPLKVKDFLDHDQHGHDCHKICHQVQLDLNNKDHALEIDHGARNLHNNSRL